jgi:MFS family permease
LWVLVAYSLISIGYVWAQHVAQLALVRFVQGMAGAVTIPIAMAYIGDLSPAGEEGRWMSYANAAFFSGFGFGPLMGGILTEHFGMSVAFFTMGGLNLLSAIIAISFLPEAARRKTRSDSRAFSFKELTSSDVIKGLFGYRLAESFGRGGLSAFLPIYTAMIGLSTSLIGTILTMNILAMTLMTPLGGMIADRFNRVTITIIGSFLGTVVLVAITLTHNFAELLTIMLVQGIGGAIAMPAVSALIVEEGRKYGMGSTMSVFYLAMGIGMVLGPIISGEIADSVSVKWVFCTGAIVGLAGTTLLISFTRRRKPVPQAPDHT